MKPPPLLVGGGLLFWGWQAGYPLAGALLAVILESARWVRMRWDFSDEDFNRLWTFCTLLLIGTALYAFSANQGPTDFLNLFQNPSYSAQRDAGLASSRTAALLMRWLPMIFFPFIAAQYFSSGGGVPLHTISLILSRRWKKAVKEGRPPPTGRTVDVSYPYFAVCLTGASFHTNENTYFFWGMSGLLVWLLWWHRSRRFGFPLWMATLAAAVALGYIGQLGLSQVQQYLGNLNPRWLAHFGRRGFDPSRSRTMLGQVGQLKASGRIVIRLQPKDSRSAPTLLREASYNTYKATTWYAGSMTNDFITLSAEKTNNAETTWLLLPGETNAATAVGLACYLPGGSGLLPLPSGSARLENLPAFGMQMNSFGALFAQGPGLVIFDAYYGPGATTDSPANTNDVHVPLREAPALDQVVKELNLENHDLQTTLRALSGFFQSRFKYSTWESGTALSSTNETPLSRFLLRTHSGHCEYFATATVLLLRQLHIPARYAVGYAVHEGSRGNYVVRQRDAHAWCLVWNQARQTWEDFDTTPAAWIATEGQRASPLQFLSDCWSRLAFEFSRFRWGQSHLRQYLLWALVPVLTLLLYQILFRRRRQQRLGATTGEAVRWPGLDSEFYELEHWFERRGLVRQPSQPLSVWLLQLLADPALTGARAPLHALLRLHYRYRFDPAGLNAPEREALREEVKTCLEILEKTPPPREGAIQPHAQRK